MCAYDCSTCGNREYFDGRYVECPYCDHKIDLQIEDMSDCDMWEDWNRV